MKEQKNLNKKLVLFILIIGGAFFVLNNVNNSNDIYNYSYIKQNLEKAENTNTLHLNEETILFIYTSTIKKETYIINADMRTLKIIEAMKLNTYYDEINQWSKDPKILIFSSSKSKDKCIKIDSQKHQDQILTETSYIESKNTLKIHYGESNYMRISDDLINSDYGFFYDFKFDPTFNTNDDKIIFRDALAIKYIQ